MVQSLLVDAWLMQLAASTVSSLTRNSHEFRRLFHPIQAIQYNLRPRAHNFNLPEGNNIDCIPKR